VNILDAAARLIGAVVLVALGCVAVVQIARGTVHLWLAGWDRWHAYRDLRRLRRDFRRITAPPRKETPL
jgi:hypothetical protein